MQDGTPTPDAPIDIKGLADSGSVEVKTCGKNILSHNISSESVSGVNITVNDDKSIKLLGTTTELITQFFDELIDKLTVGQKYIVTDCTNVRITENGTNKYLAVGEGLQYTITENTTSFLPYLQFNSGAILDKTYYPMVRKADEDSNYEPYTETTASIPITAPLYDGDYMEVYADGSGKLVRVNAVVSGLNGWYTDGYVGDGYRYSFGIKHNRRNGKMYSAHYPQYNHSSYQISGDYIENAETLSKISLRTTNTSLSTSTLLKNWMLENNVYIIVKLATPTEETLTPEQVEQFRKLYTFDNVTNVFCDGEVSVRYYVNNECGDTVGMLNDLSYLNNMPVGTVIQVDSVYDIMGGKSNGNWLLVGKSTIDVDDYGSAVSLVTNVYRKIK